MAIYTPGNVTTTAGNVYVSTGNTAVMWLSLCNYANTTVYANVFVVPNGNAAGNLTCIAANLEITGGDTYQLYTGNERLLLGTGDSIAANVSANSSVTAICSYTTY